MTASKSKIAANNRYRDKNYDQLSIAITKGKKEEYKKISQKLGISLAGLVQNSIEEYIINHSVELNGQ